MVVVVGSWELGVRGRGGPPGVPEIEVGDVGADDSGDVGDVGGDVDSDANSEKSNTPSGACDPLRARDMLSWMLARSNGLFFDIVGVGRFALFSVCSAFHATLSCCACLIPSLFSG